MNSAHIHLILSHLPVIGTLFGFILLVFAFLKKSDEFKRLALVTLVLAAILTIPVYLTGEPSEEIVEELRGVSDAFIDQHEDSAVYSLILMAINGGAALLGLVLFNRPIATRIALIAMLTSVAGLGSIGWTANLGGKIRHTEIQANSVQETQIDKHAERDDDEDNEDEDDDDH